MLGRKQSIKVGDTAGLLDGLGGLASGATLTGINGPNESASANLTSVGGINQNLNFSVPATTTAAIELAHNNTGIAWFNKTSVRHFMRICSVASLISVCANTSKTFSWYPKLMLITFIVDIITGIVFTIEMVFKIYSRGLLRGNSPYLKDRWCQFDAVMVLFIWISILLQVSSILYIFNS